MTRYLLLALVFAGLSGCEPKVDTQFGEAKLEPQKPAEIKGTVPARGGGGIWRLRFFGVGMASNDDAVAVSLTNYNARPITVNVRGGKPATVGPRESTELYRGTMRGLYRAGRGRLPEFDISSDPDGAGKVGLTFDTAGLTAPLSVQVFAVRPPPTTAAPKR